MSGSNLQWSNWQPLTEPTECWGSGVYQVRFVIDGKPKPINRFRGTDEDGRLTIGLSKSIEQRRKQFLNAVVKCYGHSAGNLLNLVLTFCQLEPKLTIEHLQIRFAALPTLEDAEQAEAHLLRTYILKHCEPPPLNSAIPDKYGSKHGEWALYEEEA